MNNLISPVTIIQHSMVFQRYLIHSDEMDFKELQTLTGMDDISFYMTIGYLLKEGKIIFFNGENGMRIRIIT